MSENASAKLQVEINATDNASPKAREAGGAFRALGEQLSEIGKVAAGVAIGNFGAQLGSGLAEHFKDAITEVQNFGASVYQLQQRLGLTSQSASGLLSVFERYGVSSDSASRTLDFFSRGLRNNIDATEGGIEASGQFQGVLAELGVSATDTMGHFRPVDEVLGDVIDRMHAVSGDGQTAARAIVLFGRAGADLAPVLNLTKEQFQDLQGEASRLGVTLTQQNVDAIRQLAMAHHDLDEATRGLSIQLGLLTVGPLTAAATGAAGLAAAINNSVIKTLQAAGAAVDDYKKKLDSLPHLKPEDQKLVDQTGVAAATGDVAAAAQPKSLGDFVLQSLTGVSPDDRDAMGQATAAIAGFIRDHNILPKLNGNPTVDDIVAAARPEDQDELRQAFEDGAADSSNAPKITVADAQDRRDASQSKLTHQESLKQLNIAELGANREMEVLQQQLNVLNRDDLDLVDQRAKAELALLPIKQRQAELEADLLETSKQRQQIDRESALQRAQLAAMPASNALEDNQYHQQLIQAQIRAGVMGGTGIPQGAISDLIASKRAEAGLQLNALEAGHDVTLAQRAQQEGSLHQQLDTADIRKSQADLAVEAAHKQADLDAVNAEIQRQALEKVPDQSDLEKKRRTLEDQIFDIHQKQAGLNGANNTINVQLTVNEATGAADYDKLVTDIGAVILDALNRAAGHAEAPAPASSPGAGF